MTALLACAAAHATTEAEPLADAAESAAVADKAATNENRSAAQDEASAPFGFRISEGPLTINSEELEADDRGGARKIVFRKQVEARQGDLLVTCDHLEALYPPGSKQPSRLVATSNVHVVQGDQQVWCDKAVYDRAGEKLLCRGNGRFVDGDSELYGREIDIDLARETVRVRGNARVVIQDDGPASSAPAAAQP